nr:immunoglobulin-like domain-containing protein [uncultured Psychroserpens sp.]
MQGKLLTLVLFCVVTICTSQNKNLQSNITEDNTLNSQIPRYKRISINNPNQAVITQLDNLGIDLTCGANISNNKLTIEVDEYNIQLLENEGIQYNVIIDDLSKFYSDRAVQDLPKARAELSQMQSQASQRTFSIDEVINNVGQYTDCDEIDWAVPANFNLNPNSSPNSFGGCLTYDMVLQELDDMRSLYPNLISVKQNASPTNQLTVEGRTVYFVRISDNPDVDEPEPETLYQSLIHARESATVMNMMYYMWYILENYNSDPAIRNLVNNQELYFIPVFNPDGFVYNQTQAPNGGGLQRKNRNTSAPGSCSQYLDGIDLNRNSAYYWGNGGASTNSCSDTYLGTAPFSENETQIMRDFFLQHDFELALNHHSFKNAMLHAYAGTTIANPRPDEYSKYNHDMTYYNRYAHGPSTSISSLNSGNMNDWMLGGPAGVSANGTPTGTGSGKNTMAWTPENGTGSEAGSTGSGFWPAPSNFVPIAKRAMRMNFLAAYFSGKYAKLHDLNQTDISQVSGNLDFAIENLGQAASDFTLTVTPVSANIVSVGGPVTETGMTVLQQNNIAIAYSLNPAIQAGDEIEFKVVLTNDYATDNVLYEANVKKIYTPTAVFEDNPDVTNLSNWTSNGGSWFTTSDAYSGTTAITTTNSGQYSNNESKRLQMNGSLDLSNSTTAIIQYYTKWDLERSFDYVQIEGSINGTNWTPLCGKLTKPGAPNANNTYSGKSTTNNNFQPDGEALYDGDTQDKWYMEEIVIDASTNSFLLNQSTVFLRFDFRTDGSNRQDSYINVDFEGFSFDDFKVFSIEAPCVVSVPTGLSAVSITDAEATINWDALPTLDFDLRYREVGSSVWIDILDISTNTQALTSLAPLTQYEVEVRSKCSSGSPSNYTTAITFTTLDVVLNYCGSQSNNASEEYISRVQLNTIDNPSGSQTYTDFTSISTVLTEGEQYDITITPTWPGTTYNEAYSVWIDYNKDGDFDDPGEQVFTQGNTQASPINGSFIIPDGTSGQSTRMRVSMKYNGLPNPCETFAYGEVEDYTVILETAGPDEIPPIITLIGAASIDLNVGEVYTELGATATDNIDGDISANIVIGGDVVNTNIAGVYVVTYNVSDAAGNAAQTAIRTITIIADTIAPVITLNGASTIDLNVGEVYTELGATATDNIDGNISASIVIGGDAVNTSVGGTYVVTYNVSDAAGNAATEVTRTVNVIPDTTAPVITLNGASIVDISVGSVYTELGATATDNIDGDISASIVIGGDIVNTSVGGTYIVTYNVSDTAGNAATEVTRTVNVIPDTTIPVITLNGAATINLNIGDIYTELGATATDNIDGDISANIVIGGNTVNTSALGAYLVTYNVNDAAGNSALEVTRTVIVSDTTPPVITLIGASTINLNLGDTYNELGATAIDNLDGDLTSSIVISGIVNTSSAGTYFVSYNVSDLSGNVAITVIRTVTVTADTTPPVITLIGAATIDLIVGDTYNELGATAIDNQDGDLTSSIIISGAVNTAIAGSYNLTYSVSDTAGNTAQTIRIVNVTEPTSGCSGGISTFPYTEGFENTLGAWTQSANDDLDWTIRSGTTPSNGTGPSSAIEGSFYVYVEASGNNVGYPSKQAILNSPCFNLSGLTDATFSFKYHQFGSTNMGSIDLEVSDDDGANWNSVWNSAGNKGNQWLTANVDLGAYVGGSIQLRFNRITGSTWQADIAIDDISLIDDEVVVNGCSGGITSFPYSEGFENTLGAWTQSTADDLDWSIRSGTTPSSGTGPSSAFQGSFYVYVEASGNNVGYPNKQAILNSPCFDLSNETSATFEFNYHQFGSTNMGTIFLEASNDDGTSWINIWSSSGNLGNSWQSESVDLSDYVGGSVQLRFNRTTGTTWQADIALDNINLTTGPIPRQTLPTEFALNFKDINIYPNPVKGDILNVKSPYTDTTMSYEIYNIVGQLVGKGIVKSNSIDISRLDGAVYQIQFNVEDKTITKRFIKQ